MRLLTCDYQGRRYWGALNPEDDQSVILCPPGADYPTTLLDLVDTGLDSALEIAGQLTRSPQRITLPSSAIDLCAPIPRPRKNIMCLGLNYAAHARESLTTKGLDWDVPEYPVVFTKAVTSVTGPNSTVELDPTVTAQLDWEAELAVIVGRRGRKIPEQNALDYVFGYTVVNDLSARDLQSRHKQFFLGKSLDGCCPMGPWIVTADEIPDPQSLDVGCRVNGVVKQAGNTSMQIFSVARTLAILSLGMTLEPGDIISTGTPEGVGFARKPPEFLRAGDVVECSVAGIGTLRNTVVGA